MKWSAFVSGVNELLPSDSGRMGLETYIPRMMRAAVIDLQIHIDQYKIGHSTVISADEMLEAGDAMQGALPNNVKIRELWIQGIEDVPVLVSDFSEDVDGFITTSGFLLANQDNVVGKNNVLLFASGPTSEPHFVQSPELPKAEFNKKYRLTGWYLIDGTTNLSSVTVSIPEWGMIITPFTIKGKWTFFDSGVFTTTAEVVGNIKFQAARKPFGNLFSLDSNGDVSFGALPDWVYTPSTGIGVSGGAIAGARMQALIGLQVDLPGETLVITHNMLTRTSGATHFDIFAVTHTFDVIYTSPSYDSVGLKTDLVYMDPAEVGSTTLILIAYYSDELVGSVGNFMAVLEDEDISSFVGQSAILPHADPVGNTHHFDLHDVRLEEIHGRIDDLDYERIRMQTHPWAQRHDLMNGCKRLELNGSKEGFITIDPQGNNFFMYPKLKNGQNLEVVWDGNKSEFSSNEELAWGEEAVLPVADFIKSKISREVDKDVVLARSYEADYIKKRRILFAQMKDNTLNV